MTKEELNIKIFEGTAGKQVLFQPRIECWFSDREFRKEQLPGELKGLSKIDMYKALDVSPRIYDYGWNCFERILDKSIKFTHQDISEKKFIYKYETPLGSIYSELQKNDSNPGVYYSKWLLETAEDIKIQTYIEEGTTYKFHFDAYNKVYSDWGNIGAPTMYIARTPYQEAVVETMGVENTTYALADEEELMEKYFEAKENANLRLIEEINKSPIRIINYGDNIHCGITPPRLIEKYILPIYERRRPLLKKANKFIHAHWDGDVKSILKYAQKAHLDGIEALTPFPQGDVSVEEIRDALGDKMILLDGIAALLFNSNYSEDELIGQVEKLIEYFAGRLILGISDEMSSNGDIERVKLVRDYVNSYNKSLLK